MIFFPFSIYFLYFPIYEGDYSNIYGNFKSQSDFTELNSEQLTLIGVPNCPFCKDALPLLRKIKDRTDIKNIDFIILSSDSSSINTYIDEGFNGLNFKLSADSTEFLRKVSGGRFPAFCLKQNERIFVWNNDKFGALARDFVESQLRK